MGQHPQLDPDSAARTRPTPPPRETGSPSPRYVLALAASLLGAPLISRFLLRDIHDALAHVLEGAVTVICITALVLPAIYTGVLLLLARRPDALARGFLPLVLVCLVALAALMAAQGAVLILTACLLGWHSQFMLVSWLGLAGLTLILGGLLTLSGLSAPRSVPPLECTGVVVTDELPRLRARVQRVAALLGVAAPPRIIVGLKPECFACAGPVALRGGDLWPAAETIYLPLLALRVLTGEELDAVIGHELAHFRGGDVYFTQRFAPAMNSLRLTQWVLSQPAKRAQKLLKLPGIAVTGMLLIADRVSARISQPQELAADRVAAQAANGAALIAAIFKLQLLELAWWTWPELDPATGPLRAAANDPPAPEQDTNLIERQLDIAQDTLVMTDRRWLRDWLFEASLANPLATHPSNSQRAQALGVDMDALLRRVLQDISYPVETEHCTYLERKITFLELRLGAEGEGEQRGGPPRAASAT
jgi:Zn-dependent protease with chaperone function